MDRMKEIEKRLKIRIHVSQLCNAPKIPNWIDFKDQDREDIEYLLAENKRLKIVINKALTYSECAENYDPSEMFNILNQALREEGNHG